MSVRFLPSMVLFRGGTAGATTCAFQDFSSAVGQADAVALVEIKKHLPRTVNGRTLIQDMQVAVLRTYLGKLDPTIVIRGDNGMAPFPYVTAYPVGTRWVIPSATRTG